MIQLLVYIPHRTEMVPLATSMHSKVHGIGIFVVITTHFCDRYGISSRPSVTEDPPSRGVDYRRRCPSDLLSAVGSLRMARASVVFYTFSAFSETPMPLNSLLLR
ncbi:hypothetical protein TNCV_979101 [Trichonephila clavipes]|nr:hypothetical protein TNCV_979101 [Trichonephila clavipes]